MTTILSLDISSVSTGYAIFKNGKLKDYSLIDTSIYSTHGERLCAFELQVDALIKKYKPDIIAAEDIYKGRNPKTHKILALYHGIAYKLCYSFLTADPVVLYPSEIRGTLSEKYNVVLKKKDVKEKLLTFDFIKAHFKLSSFEFKTHNDITDAIAIGLAVYNIGNNIEEYRGCARSSTTSKSKKKRKKK